MNTNSAMSRRIESTVSEPMYRLTQDAASLLGLTMKNFVATAISEYTMSTLERFNKLRTETTKNIMLTPEQEIAFNALLANPQAFESAYAKAMEATKNIAIDVGIEQ